MQHSQGAAWVTVLVCVPLWKISQGQEPWSLRAAEPLPSSCPQALPEKKHLFLYIVFVPLMPRLSLLTPGQTGRPAHSRLRR